MPEKTPTTAPSPSRAPGLRGLLMLNVLLLGLLAAVTFAPSADAQNRARGKYLMSAGGVKGSQSAAVYVVDEINQELMAITYNHNTKRLEGIGYRNLAYDAQARTNQR